MSEIHFEPVVAGPIDTTRNRTVGTNATPDANVIVRKTGGEDDEEFPAGNKWHVDHDGRLHIVGTNGNVATFQPDAWRSVAYGA